MEMTKILSLPGKMTEPASISLDATVLIWVVLAYALYKLGMYFHERLRGQARYRFASENQTMLSTLTDKLGGMQDRISRIDQNLDRMIKRLDQMQMAQSQKGDLQQAQQLLHDGAGTDQLIELCGLSRGEAELFQRLHS